MNLPILNPKPYALHPKQGFTLIELLVVIAIIGSLLAAITFSWTNAQAKGRDSKRKGDLKAVQQAIELYYQANSKYPSASSGQIQCNTGTTPPTNGDNATILWGGKFECDPDGTAGTQTKITYMQQLPKDPTGISQYNYANSGNNCYVIAAQLENGADPDLTGLPTPSSPCTVPVGYNYYAINP